MLSATIERQHLEENAKVLSEHIEDQLMAGLHEMETILGVVAETIRGMLIRGASFEEVKTYITEITDYERNINEIAGFVSFFAMFDIFGGIGVNGIVPDLDWDNDMQNYTPHERPWYIAAEKSNGEIVMTDPYVDALQHEVAITYVCSIYGNDGSRLAVICLDILLDRIYKIADKNRSSDIYAWMMLDRNFIIISYPFHEFLGMHVGEAHGSGIEDIAERLEQGLPVTAKKFVNPGGEQKIMSVRQIENGWYIGISTPEDSYHANLRSIFLFLIIFGVLMSSALSLIIIRISADKNKAVEEKNMLINLENIMNGLDIMIYVTEPATGEILFINDTMKRHYNIESGCMGQLCYKVLQKDLEHRCDFCPCIQLEKEPDKIIIWEEHSTLTKRIYRNVDRLIPWPNGKTVHIQHSVDMTDIIAEKEFAQQSNRYKSAFLANMSHEIRTPMNAILGIAEIQLQEKNIPAGFKEAFNKIYESGDLLLNIINDILDLSKIEAGKLELILVKYDIPSLINDTAQINRLRYDSKPIEFILEIDENTPIDMFGDELRIKQILNNILSNAFKYTEEGKVEFRVSAEKTPENESDYVTIVFRISDTGQGMTKEQIDSLFDEYSRFNLEANRTTVGTGLGMSIANRLVMMMKGSIMVESKPGKGSVFTVRIQQKKLGSDVCGQEIAEKLRNFHFQSTAVTKKAQFIREYMPYGSVLVVDDVESNIYVAKGMLFPYGLKIDTASSGYEAIEKISNGNIYDIVFMDHMMPKMDGIETTKIMRNMGYTHNIIALTANALIGREQMFLQNGFDAYISKPIDSRELNHFLNEFIRNRKPQEIVDAARLEQQEKGINKIDANDKVKLREMKELFIHDAENAVKTLDTLYEKINELNDDETSLYITTVHGMKSALYNIGEKELSGIAFTLEQAGEENNIIVLSNATPVFLNALQSLIAKYTPAENENNAEISAEDQNYLHEKLLEIKTACAAFDKNTAKNVLNDLKAKTWPSDIKSILDSIALNILHSAFRKVISAVEDHLQINNS